MLTYTLSKVEQIHMIYSITTMIAYIKPHTVRPSFRYIVMLHTNNFINHNLIKDSPHERTMSCRRVDPHVFEAHCVITIIAI